LSFLAFPTISYVLHHEVICRDCLVSLPYEIAGYEMIQKTCL